MISQFADAMMPIMIASLLSLLAIIWMMVKIWPNNALLSILTFFFWPIATIPLVQYWNDEQNSIKIPYLIMVLVSAFIGYQYYQLISGLSDEWEMAAGQTDIAAVELSAEEVCRCGTDEQCLEDQLGDFILQSLYFSDTNPSPSELNRTQNYAERAFSCVNHPKDYVPRDLVEVNDDYMAEQPSVTVAKPEPARRKLIEAKAKQFEQSSTEGKAQLLKQTILDAIERVSTAVETAPVTQQKPQQPQWVEEFRTVSMANAGQHLSQTARITRSGRRILEGKLEAINQEQVALKQWTSGGYVTYHIPQSDIQTIEIFRRWH